MGWLITGCRLQVEKNDFTEKESWEKHHFRVMSFNIKKANTLGICVAHIDTFACVAV